MATIIDSYSETNQDSVSSAICSDNIQGFAQCFTGDGQKIVDARWYLRRHNSATGNAVAKIYTMTGTFGTNGNVGTLLATSDNVDVLSTFGTAFSLITFPFSGVNQYTTVNGTHYVVSAEYSGGTAATVYVELGYDATGTHPGTWTFLQSGSWTPTDAGIDLCFYVDGDVVSAAFAGLYRS